MVIIVGARGDVFSFTAPKCFICMNMEENFPFFKILP
jgi:hypothetical protein